MSLVSDLFEEKKVKNGRPSIVSKYPEIIGVVSNFVHENGLEADMKTGSETPFRIGSSNRDVRDEIIRVVPSVLSDNPSFSISMFTFHA